VTNSSSRAGAATYDPRMPALSRIRPRLRLRVLAILGPQLGRQRGPVGWVAGAALNRLHRVVIADSVALLAPAPGAVVADVGFGGGLGLRQLLDAVGPQGTVHGVEITDLAIRRASWTFRADVRQGRLVLHQAPVADLPLADGSLSGLVTVNTIHHFDDLGAAFRAIAAALEPAGRLVVGFPDPDRQRAGKVAATHGHRPRSLSEVKAELEAAGLRLATHERSYGDAYHLMVAQRAAENVG
jgi:arsenite methyltransferase